MPQKEKTSAAKNLSKVVGDAYINLHARAAEGAFVVWIAINVPAELFFGFENVVYGVPESHAALNAAKGVGVCHCEKAERLGYSTDFWVKPNDQFRLKDVKCRKKKKPMPRKT